MSSPTTPQAAVLAGSYLLGGIFCNDLTREPVLGQPNAWLGMLVRIDFHPGARRIPGNSDAQRSSRL